MKDKLFIQVRVVAAKPEFPKDLLQIAQFERHADQFADRGVLKLPYPFLFRHKAAFLAKREISGDILGRPDAAR